MQRKWLWICLGLVVLVAAGAGATWYFVLRNTPEKTIIGKWKQDPDDIVKQLEIANGQSATPQFVQKVRETVDSTPPIDFRKDGSFNFTVAMAPTVSGKWKVLSRKGDTITISMENESSKVDEVKITVINQDYIKLEAKRSEEEAAALGSAVQAVPLKRVK